MDLETWEFYKVGGTYAQCEIDTGEQYCTLFEQKIRFDVGQYIWNEYRSVYNDNVRYIYKITTILLCCK